MYRIYGHPKKEGNEYSRKKSPYRIVHQLICIAGSYTCIIKMRNRISKVSFLLSHSFSEWTCIRHDKNIISCVICRYNVYNVDTNKKSQIRQSIGTVSAGWFQWQSLSHDHCLYASLTSWDVSNRLVKQHNNTPYFSPVMNMLLFHIVL